MTNSNGFMSKAMNDRLTIASFVLATVIALSQLWLFFLPSPREVWEHKTERTDRHNGRFREVWYGTTITQFRDAKQQIDSNDIPSDYSSWASGHLDRMVPMANVMRGISLCVREKRCNPEILGEQLCNAATLYDEGFRALGVLADDYPDETNSDVKWLLAQCDVKGAR